GVLDHLVDVLQDGLGGIQLAEAPQPRRQQRRLGGVEELGAGELVAGVHPRHEATQHDVDVADAVAAEEASLPLGALLQSSLQHVHRRERLLHELVPLLLRLHPLSCNLHARVPCRRCRRPRSERRRGRRGRRGGGRRRRRGRTRRCTAR
ncbi:Os10g0529450, partial [Oryza sativa Japonica Group]